MGVELNLRDDFLSGIVVDRISLNMLVMFWAINDRTVKYICFSWNY